MRLHPRLRDFRATEWRLPARRRGESRALHLAGALLFKLLPRLELVVDRRWHIRVNDEVVAEAAGDTLTDAVLAYYRSQGHAVETLEDIFASGWGPLEARPITAPWSYPRPTGKVERVARTLVRFVRGGS